MKSLLRPALINSLAIWLTSIVTPGLSIAGGITTIIIAGFVLLLIDKLLKPVFQIVTLPFNLLTFGLFSWVVNIVTLYLLIIFVTNVRISAFTFRGVSWGDFVIPRAEFNLFAAFIVIALTLTVIQRFLKWALDA